MGLRGVPTALFNVTFRPSRYQPLRMTAEISCEPDLGIGLPPEDEPYLLLHERAAAACRTIQDFIDRGLPIVSPSDALIDDREVAQAEELVSLFAENPQNTASAAVVKQFSAMRPAVIMQIDENLQEFNHIVVKNAVQIRTFVTNKLLLETSNPDGRIRMKALELLGKISDVGLFTERSEVTVNHRSTDDLRNSLREKLQALRARTVDAEIVEPAPVIPPEKVDLNVDLDAEFGPVA